MGERSSYGRVMPVHNLCDYFRTSIDDVIAQQGVELGMPLITSST